jgi:hypothetical protein
LLKIGTFPKEGVILKGFKGLRVQGFDRITSTWTLYPLLQPIGEEQKILLLRV